MCGELDLMPEMGALFRKTLELADGIWVFPV